MKIEKTFIDGLFVLKSRHFNDARGEFRKIFSEDIFLENQLEYDFKEFYYSVNRKDVIRGMHFQTPPYDHVKVVYVCKGKILDVIVDIRKNSNTYGKYFSIELNENNGTYLYIPKGLAHGFKSLEDDSIVNYMQTSCYNNEHDCGISYNSFGFDWGITAPIISERDKHFPNLANFNSPFSI